MQNSPYSCDFNLVITIQNEFIRHLLRLAILNVLDKSQAHGLLKCVSETGGCGLSAILAIAQNGLTAPTPHVNIRIMIV